MHSKRTGVPTHRTCVVGPTAFTISPNEQILLYTGADFYKQPVSHKLRATVEYNSLSPLRMPLAQGKWVYRKKRKKKVIGRRSMHAHLSRTLPKRTSFVVRNGWDPRKSSSVTSRALGGISTTIPGKNSFKDCPRAGTMFLVAILKKCEKV